MRELIFTICISLCFTIPIWSQSQISFASSLLVKKEVNNILEKSKAIKTTSAQERIPFELEGGLIFVEARLGDITKNYILDSGSPTLILNSKEYTINQSGNAVVGVSGITKVEVRTVKNFSLGTINSKFLKAYVTDISHLEKIKKRSIEGLIGMEHFRFSEILIDYNKKEIVVLPKKRSKTFEELEMVESIHFGMQDHMPVIRLKIGKRTYNFGLDSGAEVNLLSKRFRKKIKNGNIEKSKTKKLTGIDKNVKKVESAIIKKATLKNRAFYNMEFVFGNMEHINESHDIELDGVLGYPFLSAAIFSINYRKNKLCIWEEAIPDEMELTNPEIITSIAKAEKSE